MREIKISYRIELLKILTSFIKIQTFNNQDFKTVAREIMNDFLSSQEDFSAGREIARVRQAENIRAKLEKRKL